MMTMTTTLIVLHAGQTAAETAGELMMITTTTTATMITTTTVTTTTMIEMSTTTTTTTLIVLPYVLDMMRSALKKIEGGRVKVIQFIDRNTIHGTQVGECNMMYDSIRYEMLF